MLRLRCFLVWFVFALLGTGWALAAEPTVTCPACQGTTNCGAAKCEEGKTPCPGKCMKKEDPRWKKMKIDGYPPDKLWLEFRYSTPEGSGWQAFSQDHVGEVVEYQKGKPVNLGRCPTCSGSTRVACTTCEGTDRCKVCVGAGKFARGKELFTLRDVQGRELEAVVRSRQGAVLTVMRLADQRTFDLPLASLSAESVAEVEKRFPPGP